MLPIKKHSNLKDSDKEYIFFVGDIHGNFTYLKHILNSHIENAIVVVCGDVGIGFSSPETHIEIFRDLQNIASKKGITICFVRGNHDNPHYFNPDALKFICQELVTDFPNVMLIKDYDLLLTDFGNILCIGGGISIDRIGRELNESYWSNEVVKDFSQADFQNLSEHAIDIVVSHTAPSSFLPYGIDSDIVNRFAEYDPCLKFDLFEERELLQRVFTQIMDNWSPKFWYYGHYHRNLYSIQQSLDKTIKCRCINCNEFVSHTTES